MTAPYPAVMMAAGPNSGCWDSYYRQLGAPELPSQFALFVANEVMTGELAAPAALLDIGCGNGRAAYRCLPPEHMRQPLHIHAVDFGDLSQR